jgi:hypothetical protein
MVYDKLLLLTPLNTSCDEYKVSEIIQYLSGSHILSQLDQTLVLTYNDGP